jgi:hypothetical protein
MLEGGSSGVSGPNPSNAADRSSYSSGGYGGGASRGGSVSNSSGKKSGASEAKDFDAEVSKAKADDAPSYREAENASMDAYNEYKGTQRDKEARAELRPVDIFPTLSANSDAVCIAVLACPDLR